MIVLERSMNVAVSKGEYHVAGGRPHPEKYIDGDMPLDKRLEVAKKEILPEKVDLFDAMADEILTETGLERAMYEIKVAGIAQDPRILQPEIIFCARTDQTFDKVLRLPKKDRWETRQFHGWTKERTAQETTANTQKFLSVGIAALDAHTLLYA